MRRKAFIGEQDVLEAVSILSTGLMTASLPAVFRGLRGICPTLTIGQFHDLLRSMHAAGMVRFSPFTGAPYQLQDGEYCLILGHEIMSHVSAQRGRERTGVEIQCART